MNAKTNAERQQDLRDRRAKHGLVELKIWVHKDDVTRIKRDAATYAARRARLLKQGLVVASLEDEEKRLTAAVNKGKS